MSVYIATPTYDGKVPEAFKASLEGSLRILRDAGIPANWEIYSGCCYLPIARNKLVQSFRASGMDDLLFIDADLSWQPDAILKVLHPNKGIVAGIYPYKEYNEGYPAIVKTDSSGATLGDSDTGLVAALMVPTGFMRIKRRVFDILIEKFGESLEVDRFKHGGEFLETYYNFFDTEKIGRMWYGEDCNFCRKWASIGGEMWIVPDIDFVHYGDRPYYGNLHQYLMRLPGGINNPLGYKVSGIEGWTTNKELIWLFEQASNFNSVVEIGCFKGRSSHALLSGCKGLVHCIDPWDWVYWKPEDTQVEADKRYSEFLKNTSDFLNRVVHRGESVKESNKFNDKSIDMVFIDGDHTYSSVIDDIEAWLPKTKYLLCGHDYNEPGWPGVTQAVKEKFGDSFKSVGSIWYVNL